MLWVDAPSTGYYLCDLADSVVRTRVIGVCVATPVMEYERFALEGIVAHCSWEIGISHSWTEEKGA